MPKHEKYQSSCSNHNKEHDFRDDRRKEIFKTNRQNFKKVNKDWLTGKQICLFNEDEGSSSGSGRTSKKYQKNTRDSNYYYEMQEQCNWSRITLPHGNKYVRNDLLKILAQHLAPFTFCPFAWSTKEQAVSFCVDSREISIKLDNLSRRIEMPDKLKLIIRRNHGFPKIDLNKEMKEKIKLTLAKRYNLSFKSLDLTKFHADPDLQDCFCPLFKRTVFLTVLDIIAENIPEVEAINLFDNHIGNWALYQGQISKKIPNLKILHIGNNIIKNFRALDSFVGLPIVDLVLNGNPLSLRYKEQDALASYTSEVRKRFPKVKKLDGFELPPPISFDISLEVQLPTAQQTFLCNEDGKSIVSQFLQQYFLIFDGDRRQLAQAYHKDALLSMTMSYWCKRRDKNEDYLDWYMTDNRNLTKLKTELEKRYKLLKQGQVAVVSFLNKMPLTKHDVHSFTADLVFFSPQMIIVTVTGMFEEGKCEQETPPIRYFFRTFIIVPCGSGFCIVNETLHITNATESQAENIFKVLSETPTCSSTVDDVMKQKMITSMSEKSGMNFQWSAKCLEEIGWKFNVAFKAFSEAKEKGVIPAEAFIK